MLVPRVTVAAALVILTACGPGEDTPSQAEETAYAESAPPVGKPVKYFLFTHCGVESLRIDGRWWWAAKPLYGDDGRGSPPDGWGDPYEAGKLTLNSEQQATFEAEGTQVKFVPAEQDRPMTACR